MKNRTTLWPSNFTSGYLSEKVQNTNAKRYMNPYVNAALFTIAKIQKQPNNSSLDKDVVHTYKWNLIIYSSMDGPREYYAK